MQPMPTASLVMEQEPNDTPQQANPLPADYLGVQSDISPASDVDYFSFTAHAGDRLYAYLQTDLSTQGKRPNLVLVDASGLYYLDLYEGTQTDLLPPPAGVILPADGVYYLRVSSGDPLSDPRGRITPYRLWVTVGQ